MYILSRHYVNRWFVFPTNVLFINVTTILSSTRAKIDPNRSILYNVSTTRYRNNGKRKFCETSVHRWQTHHCTCHAFTNISFSFLLYSFFLFSNNRFNVYLPDDTYLVFSILPRGYEIQPIGSRIAKEEYRSSKYERTILFKIYKREIFHPHEWTEISFVLFCSPTKGIVD